MRPFPCNPLVLSLCLSLFACGAGVPPGDCGDEVDCGAAAVQRCTLDQECDGGLVCNSALRACSECAFDAQCAGKPETPVCDPQRGACVACNLSFDCVKALGSGHFCDAHTCNAGCTADTDCDPALGETCDTTVAPGRCGQCKDDADCGDPHGARICDPATRTCVQCTGSAQCGYRVRGSTEYAGAYASLDGARCVDETCVEGCDGDEDCQPDHLARPGSTCHLGPDANDHRCVECTCSVLSADGTYCDDPFCGGAGKVCDAATLRCRKKRQGEQCVSSSECGDLHDPAIGACVPGGACVYGWREVGRSGTCGAGAYGRCGVACDDLQNDFCTGTTACPVNSACRQASTDSGAGTFCVSSSCNK